VPYSSDEGKQFILGYFADESVSSVLDVGVGSGTYRRLLDPDHIAKWTGVEIWAPYISQFGLDKLYDEMIVSDAYYLDWTMVGYPDLTILGDVLEHMPRDRARMVLRKAVHRSKYVIVSIPIIHYPQGAEFGNKWETHETTWTHEMVMQELLDGYEVLSYNTGQVVGTYIISGTQR